MSKMFLHLLFKPKRLSNKHALNRNRQAAEIRLSFAESFRRRLRALVQWAGLVCDQWLCSAARAQSRAPSQEIRQFSTQLSECQWGESSPRSCCNYVALERYRGNRQPGFFYAGENVYVPIKHHWVA